MHTHKYNLSLNKTKRRVHFTCTSGAFGNSRPLWFSVLHGQFQEHANTLAEMVSDRLKVIKLEILRISPVLGVHPGPEVVGAAIVQMAIMEGLE